MRKELCGMRQKCVYTMAAHRVCLVLGLLAALPWLHVTSAADVHAIVSMETPEDDDSTSNNAGASLNMRTVTRSDVSFDTDSEPFIPTDEWQKVNPGQSIPSGLHVRMDMQTGENEAKLMEGDDGSRFKQLPEESLDLSRLQQIKKNIEGALSEQTAVLNRDHPKDVRYWKDGKQHGMMNSKSDFFTRDELKDALKKFKVSSDDVKDQTVSDKTQKFRSMAELKKELADLDLSIKTDPEVIKDLLTRYRSGSLSVSDKKEILEGLEYYVHQIDNANDFVDMGGILLLKSEFNHTNATVRSEALFVLGSALQSNPSVQIQTLKSGILDELIRMLYSDPDLQVQSRAVYALSTLVRHFPLAQEALVDSSGLQALVSLLLSQATLRSRVKVITLLSDLLLEQRQTQELIKEQQSDSLTEKLNQYNRVNLEEKLQAHGICDVFPDILAEINSGDANSAEKVVVAMETLHSICQTDFVSSTLTELRRLQEEYKILALVEKQSDDEDSYFSDLHQKIVSLIKSLKSNPIHQHEFL